MKKIIDRIFSEKYVHPGVNFAQLLMYRFAYPFAVLLNKLRLSPNQITTLSLVFSIFAFIALVNDEGWVWFSICWGMSVLLDFCDGTVARMSDRVSKPAFRYDHMSDLFKISLLFLGAGLRYDNNLVWTISSSVIFLFMYFTVLNHELNNVRKLAEKNRLLSGSVENVPVTRSESAPVPNNRIRDRYRIAAWAVKHDFLFKIFQSLLKIYQGLRSVLMTINGHTLLLFFLVPLGSEYAAWAFFYFGLIALLGIWERIILLLAIPKP